MTTFSPSHRAYIQDVNNSLHESGHLSVAISLGIPATATIEGDATSSGRVSYDPTGVELESRLFIGFGAVAVVEKFQLHQAGLLHDFADIANLLLSLPAAEKEILTAKARSDAGVFVEKHLGCIVRLALALIERRRLDADTAKKVFAGEIIPDIPDDFCAALRLMPHVIWR